MKVILASQSPWRKELLSWLGLQFVVIESQFDETQVQCDDPEELVITLATAKARKVGDLLRSQRRLGTEQGIVSPEAEPRYYSEAEIILGADTVIVIGDEIKGDLRILGKPENRDAARVILKKLQARSHDVYTGVALLNLDTDELKLEVVKTTITFKDFSDKELEAYLKTGEYMGKAGAYQILGTIRNFVLDIKGSITNVIGLPLETTVGLLEETGVPVDEDVRSIVLAKTGYPD